VLLKATVINIEKIYVPGGLRKELDPQRVELVAEEIMEEAEEHPIQVRQGKDRYVLVKGVHRLAARKALGDKTIQAFIVAAQQH
jgi:ParB-like chromosome segregation protein Spo0J